MSTLAHDQLDSDKPLLRLYNDDRFLRFIAYVVGKENLFRLEDPLGATSINICPTGTSQNWHFDEAKFTVTIMIQKPEDGGQFKLTKPIRNLKGSCSDDEDFYKLIDGVLTGDQDVSSTLEFEPGTLSIFCGSVCLHKVTETLGKKDRLVAVLCFADEAGRRNSDRVQEKFWGRIID